MSSSFSLSRLVKLIKKEFFENARLYLLSILALFGLLALIFTFWIGVSDPDYHEEGTYLIFLMGLYISGSAFASMSFSKLGSKDKGIYWLGIPATHSEKLICSIFYSTILFTIVYCLVYYAVKSLAISFLLEYIKKYPGSTYTEMTDFEHDFGGVIRNLVFGYFGVQSIYLLGSVYFSRYSFIVTSVLGAFILLIFGYYLTRLNEHILGNNIVWNLITADKSGDVQEGVYRYSVSSGLADFLTYAIRYAWAPLFWVITWIRLKEKEI